MKLIDADIRHQAVSEHDRNLIVTAGAGTGKTTLLVDRVLHLLLGRGCSIREVIALTFTEKAANEMKVRVREKLEEIIKALTQKGKVPEALTDKIDQIKDCHNVTAEQIGHYARQSLDYIDQAMIGTIHSFAAHLLRLYPIESGVDPGFKVDEGQYFKDLFDQEWSNWLGKELVIGTPNEKKWLTVLEQVGLNSLEKLARALADFTLSLEELRKSLTQTDYSRQLKQWLKPLAAQMKALAAQCTKPNNNLQTQLNETSIFFNGIINSGLKIIQDKTEEDLSVLKGVVSSAKQGWAEADVKKARDLVKESRTIIKGLLKVDHQLLRTIVDLLLPFARHFRETFLKAGYLSFEGLLALTRDLLRNYPGVRASIKKDFKAVLVDEFQDTSPIQYEIILFLAEAKGQQVNEPKDVKLEKGKLFIVGDPKQSIYAFRRADIEAFDWVREIITKQQGAELPLQANFRSHQGILEPINNIFEQLIVKNERLQPDYIPIIPQRPAKLPAQKIETILITPSSEGRLKADDARAGEAEAISQWLAHATGSEEILDPAGQRKKLEYRDVAILFRGLTQIQPYLEAFRRHQIPYVVEGEKYFYSNQEILDFFNLLRVIENPHDRVALIGLLRSPLAGFTDREIYQLKQMDLFDYRQTIPAKAPRREYCRKFYGLLNDFHQTHGRWSISKLIDEIFRKTFLLEITAGYLHGEQRLANLMKIYQMAVDMGREGNLTLKAFLHQMKQRINELEEEGESPLADETLDAVKILSIHKSKGLEFPVVILANMHGQALSQKKDNSQPASFDWTSGKFSLALPEVRNLEHLMMVDKESKKNEAEAKRLIYVAMTRARERLILSGSSDYKDNSYFGFIFGSMGRDAPRGKIDLKFGKTSMAVKAFAFDETTRRRSGKSAGKPAAVNWPDFAKRWKKRGEKYQKVSTTPWLVSPTTLAPEFEKSAGRQIKEPKVTQPVLIGSIVHKVLEGWDFSKTESDLTHAVSKTAKSLHYIYPEVKTGECQREATQILKTFLKSGIAREIKKSNILGREIPILLPGKNRIIQGAIDVCYKINGRVVVADYKTDRVGEKENLAAAAKKYRTQKDIYTRAIEQTLGVKKPAFKIIFLRAGEAVEM